MTTWKALLAACAVSFAAALPAAAATVDLIVDTTTGKLTGAKGVSVLGKTYDVEFVDGSCVTLFTDCGASDAAARPFAFTTLASALAASQALLDFVFIDGPLGSFDSNPSLTQGCSGQIINCSIITPYGAFISSIGPVQVYAIVSNFQLPPDGLPSPSFSFTTADTSLIPNVAFAVWREVTPIPLPAGAPLVLTGLAALAGLRWRKRRNRGQA